MTEREKVSLDPPATVVRRHRGSVACRRCRRLRVKCVHLSSSPPCEACQHVGGEVASQCCFPKRGEVGGDRDWRSRTRTREPSSHEAHQQAAVNDQTGDSESSDGRQPLGSDQQNVGDNGLQTIMDLPTEEEIIESCRVFVTSYFQLGFIPKANFYERIARKEVGDFLVLCILCLSARFTPCLVAKYGTGEKATAFFSLRALELVPQKMYKPSLENTQGFFLLSIAEWGNGDKDRSTVHMGIAVRMAATLKLHREETYHLDPSASREAVIQSEMGRRTFWMIQSQDNLQSGYNSPAPFALDDITALLPCEESDFLFGINPPERAALQGTPPAMANPLLADSPKRSLFAALIQAHSLWGQVARRACGPWEGSAAEGGSTIDASSDYTRLVRTLRLFEEHLPEQQKWSVWNLRVWRDLGFEFAYLSVVMMLRLSNIMVRRIYLEDIKACLTDSTMDPSTHGFWKTASNELFRNVDELYEQINLSLANQPRTQAYPAILVLPIYVCGSLALNLWRCPELCLDMADRAVEILKRCMYFISELQLAWPMARAWQQGLQQAATPLSQQHSPRSPTNRPAGHDGQPCTPQAKIPSQISSPKEISELSSVHMPPTHAEAQAYPGEQFSPAFELGALPHDLFHAEVTAYLQGEAYFGYRGHFNEQH